MPVNAVDASAIADVLAAIISDKALCNQLRQKGLHRVAHFRWANSAAALLNTYKEAIARSRSSQ